MLKQNVPSILFCLFLIVSQVHGRHFQTMEEDLASFINRVVEFASTGVYKPHRMSNSNKLLKNIFTKLIYKGHIDKLSDLDKIILVYLIVDIGKRQQDEQEKTPVYWLSRQGRRR